MKKHAEHEAEVPVPETAPEGVAQAQADKGNGETQAAEAKADGITNLNAEPIEEDKQ